MPVVMRACFGVRVDCDRAGPQLAGAGSREGNCRGTRHARRLGGIRIQGVGGDDLHAGLFPGVGGWGRWVGVVIGGLMGRVI